MLTYSEERFKREESTKETMLSDLAAFVLEYTSADDAEIYKRTTYHGNVKRERYVSDPDLYPFGPEFIVWTEYFYGKVKVEWWNTENSVKRFYTETKGE